MSREELTVQKREVTGRKVRKLRREGFVPGIVYGITEEPLLVSCKDSDVFRLLKSRHETELIDIVVDGTDDARVVLIQDMQLDPIHNKPIHIDFYEPNLKETVDVDVALELVGESPAVEQKLGVLLHTLESLPIRVLPTAIPHYIEVDVGSLAEVGDQIGVLDIKLPDGVELMLDNAEDIIVAKINALRTLEEEVADEEEAEGEQGEESANSEDDEEESEE